MRQDQGHHHDPPWFGSVSLKLSEKGGVSLRGVAVMTETAKTTEIVKRVETVTVASLSCML